MDDDDNDLANIINYVLGVANRLSQQPVSVIYLSMFSPRGVPQACVGHLTSIAFPTLGNLTKNLGPRVGTFAFFCAEEWDQVTLSHVLVCALAMILELM